MLLSIAFALAGRAGARLAAKLAVAVSRMTLLRLVRAHAAAAFRTPDVLGVDDFALRKGHVYASVIVDMRTRRPIEVLAGRDAQTLAGWLREHPGVEIITRDRAGSYAQGSRQGAPDAVELADRFHLWQNLGEAVEKSVVAHRACLREPAQADAENEAAGQCEPQSAAEDLIGDERLLEVCGRERLVVARTRERYAAILELRAKGLSPVAIGRELGISTRTVHRFLRTAGVEEKPVPAANRSTKIDRFRPYLDERWNAGVTNAAVLYGELQALGRRGSRRTVNRYAQRLRTLQAPPPIAPRPPKPRRVAGWIMSDPDHLASGSAVTLKEILARCPELEAVRRHAGTFANMIQNLGGDRLPA
jgi:transposase